MSHKSAGNANTDGGTVQSNHKAELSEHRRRLRPGHRACHCDRGTVVLSDDHLKGNNGVFSSSLE